ncbi:MerR family transcriptional regulator [Sphaerisporangium siamense]|uniref:DNA-binding transcriptional MerR regulator n=1 Tax=Sphaerisporangium siamense TaxID=795645 RepID=A0A7W7DCR7_9ACTN|nr:MerR family transcriptional regulator [Sphaerisporangium siamense]MBB4703640.1 DNA-binding transcriptional MerR regulator [Sphaerisporangium siamense]GII82111.1 MerR family transcriptional regulator [Sphaerisporangium siamense]
MDDEDSGALMPIGRFARLCRLSVKQLRHYADLGLLEPAHVDPLTGYRYYRAGQARDALSIGLLRSLDVPLAAIGDLLAGAEPADALGRVRDAMEAELTRRRRALATLEHLLAGGLPTVPVSVVHEPARRVLVTGDLADGPGDIGRVTSLCVTRLPVELRASMIGLFPIELGDRVPVTVAAVAGPGVERPGLTARVLPGGPFARAVHTGPYDQTPLTAHGLLAWCAERGHHPRGPLREVYVSDPALTPPDELITYLMVPLDET